jgi:DNA repair protein RecO (recombination protein O)
MANEVELTAYILHRRPYRETSALVTFFSAEEGKFNAVVRGMQGASKTALQRQAWLQPFRPLQLSWREKPQQTSDLVSLRRFEPKPTPPVILTGEASICGLYLNELLYRLLYPRVEASALFGEYEQRLQELAAVNGSRSDLAWTLRQFEFRLLDEMGYALSFEYDTRQQPISPEHDYWVVPELGATRMDHGFHSSREQEQTFSQGLKVSGGCLLKLQRWERCDHCLPAWKHLFRQALAIYLGNKPIRTRQFFQ